MPKKAPLPDTHSPVPRPVGPRVHPYFHRAPPKRIPDFFKWKNPHLRAPPILAAASSPTQNTHESGLIAGTGCRTSSREGQLGRPGGAPALPRPPGPSPSTCTGTSSSSSSSRNFSGGNPATTPPPTAPPAPPPAVADVVSHNSVVDGNLEATPGAATSAASALPPPLWLGPPAGFGWRARTILSGSAAVCAPPPPRRPGSGEESLRHRPAAAIAPPPPRPATALPGRPAPRQSEEHADRQRARPVPDGAAG